MISRTNIADSDMDFSDCLKRTLTRAGITLSELAKEADLSRQHLTTLKNRDSLPSSRLLRSICIHLKEYDDIDESELIPLVCSALNRGSEESRLFSKDILHYIPHSLCFKSRKDNLSSRCIVSDQLLECIFKDVLLETLGLMEEGTTFYYFLPKASNDWTTMIDNAIDINPKYRKTIQDKAYCIKCPPDIIYARIRIDNIDTSHPEAFSNLGAANVPILQELQPDITSHLIGFIRGVIAKAKIARKNKETTISYPKEDIEIQFKLEDVTIS